MTKTEWLMAARVTGFAVAFTFAGGVIALAFGWP